MLLYEMFKVKKNWYMYCVSRHIVFHKNHVYIINDYLTGALTSLPNWNIYAWIISHNDITITLFFQWRKSEMHKWCKVENMITKKIFLFFFINMKFVIFLNEFTIVLEQSSEKLFIRYFNNISPHLKICGNSQT